MGIGGGDAHQVVVQVIAVVRGLACCTHMAQQAAQGIKHPLLLAAQGACAVAYRLCGAVALGIQGVFDALAQIVLYGGQAPGIVPGVFQPTAIAQADGQQLASGIVGIPGSAACRGAGGQPALGGVGQGGGDAIGIGNGLGAALDIKVGQGGAVAQGVLYLGAPPQCVITVAGGVGDIGARAIDAGGQAVGVVGVRPGAAGGLGGQQAAKQQGCTQGQGQQALAGKTEWAGRADLLSLKFF